MNNLQPKQTKGDILIVDDTLSNVQTLSNMLTEQGYEVRGARNGPTALMFVAAQAPDLILLDIRMPGLNGFEVCRRLKANEKIGLIPVIFISALEDMTDKLKSFEVGGVDYITKPFQIEEVLARVKTHLTLYKLQVEKHTSELAQANANLKTEIVERKQAEESLRESEERFRQVITSISDHIYMTEVTEAGEYINHYISPNVETLTGYPAEKFATDWRFWGSAVIHPHDRAGTAIRMGRLVSGQEGETEYRLVRADEQVIWVRDSARVESAGTSKFIYGVVNEISERKQAQESLRESEERYRNLFEDVPVGLYRSTPEGQVLDINMAMVEMLGYPDQETLLAANAADSYTAPEKRRQWQTLMEREGVVRDFEVQHRRYDGTIIWVSNSSRVIRDDEGRVLYYEGSLEDITVRKQAGEEIRKLNQQLEQRVTNRTRELSALYEVTAVAGESLDLKTTLERSLERVLVAMRSNMGLIHLLDKAAERSGEQMLRLAIHQGLSPETVVERDTVPLGSGLTGWVLEYDKPLIVPDIVADPRAVRVAGISAQTAYVGLPIRARRRVLGVLGVLKEKEQPQFKVDEITLLMSIADHVGVVVESARLRQLAEQAAVLEERGRLARELHDSVTQSLYSLALFAEWGRRLFESGELESAKQRLIRIGETTQHALKEMRLLVYELRPAMLEQDGLGGALQRRLDAVEKRAGVEVSLLAEPLFNLPSRVEEGLYRIAQEALNNALKHATASLVTVRVHADEQRIRLEVEDNGVGFTPHTVSDKGGLGLVSMQERAEQLGGVLTMISSPGEGTTVKVELRNPKSKGVF